LGKFVQGKTTEETADRCDTLALIVFLPFVRKDIAQGAEFDKAKRLAAVSSTLLHKKYPLLGYGQEWNHYQKQWTGEDQSHHSKKDIPDAVDHRSVKIARFHVQPIQCI
jgi:hypothetical protein